MSEPLPSPTPLRTMRAGTRVDTAHSATNQRLPVDGAPSNVGYAAHLLRRPLAHVMPFSARYDFFATLNMVVGVCTLLVQTFFFSHILKLLGFHGTLLAEPVALAVGLIVAIVHPGLLSIALLDGMRKVFHYSLVKPTKEGLYAALPRDVIFVAKPLLDTLIYRTGSLIGAGYFTWAMNAGLMPETRRYILLIVSVVWMANSWWVGILAERQQRAHEEEENAKAMGGVKPTVLL